MWVLPLIIYKIVARNSKLSVNALQLTYMARIETFNTLVAV